MNIREGNTVNTLLQWLLGVPRAGEEPVSEEQAREAAAFLAARADTVLGAGLTAADVDRHWPGRSELVTPLTPAVAPAGEDRLSIVCPRCTRRSYHPEDVANRYCGACNQFHDVMEIGDQLSALRNSLAAAGLSIEPAAPVGRPGRGEGS